MRPHKGPPWSLCVRAAVRSPPFPPADSPLSSPAHPLSRLIYSPRVTQLPEQDNGDFSKEPPILFLSSSHLCVPPYRGARVDAALCEVHIGYLPNKRVLGLSKLA
ncbi:hypothetical protein GN956_G26063, partial [Arapaima gigas]